MSLFDRRRGNEGEQLSSRLSQWVARKPGEEQLPASVTNRVTPESPSEREYGQPSIAAEPVAEPVQAGEEEQGADPDAPVELVQVGSNVGVAQGESYAFLNSTTTGEIPVLGPDDSDAFARTTGFVPARPESVEDTGLPRAFIAELVLRHLYQANELMGSVIAERVALPFPVIQPILENIRHDQEIEVKGQRGVGDAGYVYGITERGSRRARESLERLGYIGPAPVPFDEYIRSVQAQSVQNVVVTQSNIREAFHDLIVEDEVLDLVGPAVNSASSMFLFGSPGNGKTAIAERITKLMGDYIFIPRAIEVDGTVITLFDAINHQVFEEKNPDGTPKRANWDQRWARIERPVVMVGGELTMASLDLLWNDTGKFYEAPLQLKANGGMFLIDDFGRQMVRPQDLLNRWIVPLEKKVDFLNLVTGKKLAVPFDQLIVFSTNLDPKDLVDDAFLRRIKFKINVLDPEVDQFRTIFQAVADRRGVPFDEQSFQYMLERYYRPFDRPLRMCQPRDILDQILAIAKYKVVPPAMTQDLIDRACTTYFVNVSS